MRKGQQEMVGFVLIVVLVMVGLMVFLIVSLGGESEVKDSVEASNMLSAIMRTTTECAISFEPDYDDFEDLFKSCYSRDRCINIRKDACDYLNESLKSVVEEILETEASISAYEIDFFESDSSGTNGILRFSGGNCEGDVISAQRVMISGSKSLKVRLKLCKS